MKQQFTIPKWRPTRLNEILRMGPFTRSKRKKSDAGLIAHYSRGVTRAIGKRRVSLTIVLKPRGQEGDDDGLWKFLLDGLVKCGALLEDSRQFVEMGGIEYQRGTEKTWGTTVTLEDVE